MHESRKKCDMVEGVSKIEDIKEKLTSDLFLTHY